MKKLISIFILIILTTVVTTSTGCTSRAIAMEIAQSLIQMNKGAIENIDSGITKIDQQLYDTQVRLLKLEQLLTAALQWVDYQKTIERTKGKWSVSVTQSGLTQLQNDQYKVTALKAIITSDSKSVTELSYTIEIFDSQTMRSDDVAMLQDNLTDSKNRLEQNRKAMIDARDLSVSTMNNILKYVNDWKVKRVSGSIYSVSGPGLGWSEQLTNGAWTYDQDKGTLLPYDQKATDLNKIILGKVTPR